MMRHLTGVTWAAAWMFLCVPARAYDTSWTGGGDGASWSDPANWSAAPNGARRVSINGTPTVNVGAAVNAAFTRFLVGDSTDSNALINMSGGSLSVTAAGNDPMDFQLASAGKATLHMTGGTITVGSYLRIGTDPPPATPEGVLTIDDGTVSVGSRLFIGQSDGAKATLNINGGAVTANQTFCPDGKQSTAAINMTGGTLTTGDLWVPTNTDAAGSTGHIELIGGTINVTRADSFRLSNSTALGIVGTMNIRQGTLIIAGDATTTVSGYVSSGKLSGYGYADTGHVLIDYQPGSNTTTVTAVADASCFIQPPDLPQGSIGAAYSGSVQATESCTDVTWALLGGALPDGLSFDTDTGQITGTPEVSGTFQFTVRMAANESFGVVSPSITVAPIGPISSTRTTDVWIRESTPGDQAHENDLIRMASSVMPGDHRRYGLVEFDLRSLSGVTLHGARLMLHQPGLENYAMKQSAFAIATQPGILTESWNSYFASKNAAKQAFTRFGRFELPGSTNPGEYYDSASAVLADLAIIQAEADGDGVLTLVLIPDEDGHVYSRHWGDGVAGGEPALLVLDVGGSCVIVPAGLPDGTQGLPYNATLAASSGCGSVLWEISGCYLPPGLQLNASNGAISGLARYSGSFSFTAKLTPSSGSPQTQDFAINIHSSPADLNTDGDVDGDDYALFLTNFSGPQVLNSCVPGGNDPAVYLQAAAETWVRPSDSDGVYDGDNLQVRSAAAGNQRIGLVEFDVSSLSGQAIQSAYLRMHVGILNGGPMKCSAFAIPSGIAGATYDSYVANQDASKLPFVQFGRFELTQESATEDSFLATSADLQLIANKAANGGLLTLVLFADEDGAYGRKWGDGDIGPKAELVVTAGPPCHIQTLSLPAATAGTPYNATLQASGDCSGTLQWQVSACALPQGLTLNPSTGAISGTPHLSGTAAFEVQLTSAQGTRVRNLAIDVGAGAPGDFDNDGDVDLEDFDILAQTFTGLLGTRPVCGTASFNSTDTPKNIPDGGSVTSVITLPPGITVGDINAYVDITHGARVDVKVTLTSPAGTTVMLKDFSGDPVPFVPTTYDDQGILPAQPLSAFNGQNATGNWVLTAYDYDTFYIDNGVLNGWKLIITGQ